MPWASARNDGSERVSASPSGPQAITSTRLQVERIAPSNTPGICTSARSVPSRCPFGTATRSRSSTGAVWCESPISTIEGSTSEEPPVPSEPERVHTDERQDDDREPRDGELRGEAATPARGHPSLEQDDVYGPGADGDPQLRIEHPRLAPGLAPGLVRPHDARQDGEREQHETPHHAAVAQAV